MQVPEPWVQAIEARLGELEPGFGGRVAFRAGGGVLTLRLDRAGFGRSLTGAGTLAAAVLRQLSPWGFRLEEEASGPHAVHVTLAEGDEARPHLLSHLAEGLVLGLAALLGERFSFPCSDRTYEERDLTIPSGIRPTALEARLAGTGLAGLGEAFCQAEAEAGLNGLALVALAAWQSAWGKARIARVQRNLLGWGARPDGAPGPAYPTAEDSIVAAAPLIRRQYLEPDGRCFAGPNLTGMNLHYAVDPLWRHGVAAIWRRLAGG